MLIGWGERVMSLGVQLFIGLQLNWCILAKRQTRESNPIGWFDHAAINTIRRSHFWSAQTLYPRVFLVSYYSGTQCKTSIWRGISNRRNVQVGVKCIGDQLGHSSWVPEPLAVAFKSYKGWASILKTVLRRSMWQRATSLNTLTFATKRTRAQIQLCDQGHNVW